MSIPNVRQYLAEKWPSLAVYVAVLLALAGLLIYKLDALPAGYSAREAATFHSSVSLHDLQHNPINAPFLLLERAFVQLTQHSFIWGRVVAVGCGLVMLAVFCALLRYWHNKRTALIGTVLLGTSSWFLHLARLGTPDVLALGLFLLIACGVWLKASHSRWALLILFLLGASLLYVPGMVWLIGLGVVWQWRLIDRTFKKHLGIVTLGALLLLAILAPLGWAVYQDPHLLKQLAGLPPGGWPHSIDALLNILRVPFHIFVRGPLDPEIGLPRAPLLDVFAEGILLIGLVMYAQHIGLRRTKLLAAIFALAAVLVGLGGMSIGVMLPFLYLLVAAGVMHMLELWLKVFPRNPIARGLGYGMLGLAVALSSVYHIRAYFIAWPATPEVQTTFIQHAP